MKRILVSRAAETYAVESIEKIGTVARYRVVGLSDVSGIVTDAPPGEQIVQQLREQGVDVIQASW